MDDLELTISRMCLDNDNGGNKTLDALQAALDTCKSSPEATARVLEFYKYYASVARRINDRCREVHLRLLTFIQAEPCTEAEIDGDEYEGDDLPLLNDDEKAAMVIDIRTRNARLEAFIIAHGALDRCISELEDHVLSNPLDYGTLYDMTDEALGQLDMLEDKMSVLEASAGSERSV